MTHVSREVRVRSTGATSTSGTTDSVNIVLTVVGKVIIDDVAAMPL